jgi:putative ABC transport system substrate-binding protein
MRRRRFLALLSSVALLLSRRSEAQVPGKMPRIGFIEAGSQQANQAFLDIFQDAMRALGWSPGSTVDIIDRWAEAREDRLSEIIQDLISSKIDILVTAARPATFAAMRATRTIPIVSVGAPDLVADGAVASLARPGGNVTGVISMSTEVISKGIELLHEALPAMVRLAVLWNPAEGGSALRWTAAKNAGETQGLTLISLEATTPDLIERIFADLPEHHVDALYVTASPFTVANRARIVALATAQRLPIGSSYRGFTVEGGMVSAGTNLAELFRLSARLVDKVLKGALPADLPVELAPVEFVVNLKAARALGIDVPQAITARADEVIE